MTQEADQRPRGLFYGSLVRTTLAAAPVPLALPPAICREEKRIVLRDTTDQLLVDVFWQPQPSISLLLVHGVGGSAQAGYVYRAIRQGVAAGFHVMAVNLRGAGKGAELASKFYHGGLISDIEDCVSVFANDDRVQRLAVVGFSLGGNAVLKLAARGDAGCLQRIAAVASISAPFDLLMGCRHIDSLPSFPYRRVLFRGLVNACAALPAASLPIPLAAIRRLPTLQSFDDQVTAPMHGFLDSEDYYRHASCGPDFPRIAVPTLCVHAKDDPLIPTSTLQPSRGRASSSMQFCWLPYGGHVGFVPSPLRLGQSAAIDHVIAFIREQDD